MTKCPNCGKQASELDEKCKYCGVNFEKFEEKKQEIESKENEYSYVTAYNAFICIAAIVIFVGGIMLGQEETSIMFTCWISGLIVLVIMNMLKNIIEELRKLNAKIK